MKKKRLRLEKEPDNFGLRTPYAGFTPLTPRASHQSQEPKSSEILTEKILIIHRLLIH